MLLYQSEKQLINTLTAGKTECTEHMVNKSVADRRDYHLLVVTNWSLKVGMSLYILRVKNI